MKSIFKILYFALAIFIMIIVGLYGYQVFQFQYVQGITNAAIDDKNYAEIAKIHGACFDKRAVATNENEKFGLAVFPASSLSSVTLYSTNENDEEVATTTKKYTTIYNLYLINLAFDYSDANSGSNSINNSAIRFYANDLSYDYLFKINESVNSSKLVKKPTTEAEFNLSSERDLTEYYKNWNIVNFPITFDLIEDIKATMGNNSITHISVIDNAGNEVANSKTAAALDFSQEFFKEEGIKPLVDNYNKYLEDSNSSDETTKNNAESVFNEFYNGTDTKEGFEKTFLANENHQFRYGDDQLAPGSIVWKTIGIEALFVLCVAIIYMVLFHFAFLKGLIFRDKSSSNTGNYRARNKQIMEEYKKKQAMEAEVVEKQKSENQNDNKPE